MKATQQLGKALHKASHLLSKTIYFLKAGQGKDLVHWVKQVLSATG
jgi:hypothetical protein